MVLSSRAIAEIERAHPAGLSSKEILEVLQVRGEHLTEATLRKYVQLGLLPRSKRVGEKGKHRGSRGIYPVEVIRRIGEIRRSMSSGATLEQLARAQSAVQGRLSTARACLDEVLAAAEADLEGRHLGRGARSGLRSDFALLRRQALDWIGAMETWAESLREASQAPGSSGARPSDGLDDASRTARVRRPKIAQKRSRRPGGV